MNCDQVFDILTRGPFPTGESCDERVERHLLACPDCRRLAAALQPAVELFEEAVTPEESRELPGYWGELFATANESSTARVQPAKRVLTALRPSRERTIEEATSRWSFVWRFAAVLLLGACLGAMLRGLDLEEHAARLAAGGSEPPKVQAAPVAAEQPEETPLLPAARTRQRGSLVHSLGMATACLKLVSWEPAALTVHLDSDAPNLMAEVELSSMSCCTECHSATSQVRVAEPVALNVSRSCMLCHQ